jgi:hypothetical protein
MNAAEGAEQWFCGEWRCIHFVRNFGRSLRGTLAGLRCGRLRPAWFKEPNDGNDNEIICPGPAARVLWWAGTGVASLMRASPGCKVCGLHDAKNRLLKPIVRKLRSRLEYTTGGNEERMEGKDALGGRGL